MSYRVLLATRSPLYAPVCHAWATAPDSLKDLLDLDFSTDWRSGRDDLVCQTLTKYNHDRKPVLLAVGDLTRLTSYIDNPNGLRPPKILGGLIDRLCLWLVDHGNFEPIETKPEDRKILCHPRHMTTYHVAKYHMANEGWDSRMIDRRILPFVSPGLEQQFYQTLRYTSLSRVAFMSTEIPRSHSGIEVEFSELAQYRNISMTGIFCAADLTAAHLAIAAKFLDRIKESIRLLYTEGDRVAWELYKDETLPTETGLVQDYSQLCDLGQSLHRIDAYSTNLELTSDQIAKMLRIRLSGDEPRVESLLTRFREFAAGVPEIERQIEDPSDQIVDLMAERYALRLALYAPKNIRLPLPFNVTRGLIARLALFLAELSVYLGHEMGFALVTAAQKPVTPWLFWGGLAAPPLLLAIVLDLSFRRKHAAVPPLWTMLTLATILLAILMFFEFMPNFLGGMQEWLPGIIVAMALFLYNLATQSRRHRLRLGLREGTRKFFGYFRAIGVSVYTTFRALR